VAGTISFGGIGSGIDTEGIVSGLVNASKGTQKALEKRADDAKAAVSSLSEISSLLSTLKSKVTELDEVRKVNSFAATSSGTGIVATAAGNAQPGAYSISVERLASEQRTYSAGYGSKTGALGYSGSIDITLGGATTTISVGETDSLEKLAENINASGAKVQASVFYDGSEYRLALRGRETGAANAFTIDENVSDTGGPTSMGLEDLANRRQQAEDAWIKVDDFDVYSATNQFVSAVPGVTLAVKEKTSSPVRVEVAADPEGMKKKLDEAVSAYNAVIKKINGVAGFGTTKGSVAALQGDSALRSVTSKMNALGSQMFGSGKYQTLRSVGLSLNNDGTMTLNATKLTDALRDDPTAVSKVLAGDDNAGGVMDALRDLANSVTQTDKGALALRKGALESRQKSLTEAADREEARLSRYAETLRKQFTQMDTTVATYNAQLGSLSSLYSKG
jgi:flagellar hook-associated protein 2